MNRPTKNKKEFGRSTTPEQIPSQLPSIQSPKQNTTRVKALSVGATNKTRTNVKSQHLAANQNTISKSYLYF